ncbi:PHP domain-containing protein, partial [Saccharopolyspora gregorii]|uniref:PHP domain-containing protein n=1 Tax=Saccharopolyspora gregorii TaxID=33914 RepID=UPI003CD056AC
MTDHGNMFGAHSFNAQAKKSGIKPIIGIEAYVAPASRYTRKPVFWGERARTGKKEVDEYGESGDVSGAGAYTHMTCSRRTRPAAQPVQTVLARVLQGFFRKPRMDKELIAEHADGIIATSGCLAGEILTRLRLGQKQEAVQAASDYKDIFGPDPLLHR